MSRDPTVNLFTRSYTIWYYLAMSTHVNGTDASPSLMLSFLRDRAGDMLSSSEVAQRMGRSRQSVTSIHNRHPEFVRRTVIGYIGGIYVHYWPAVREWLREHGQQFGEPAGDAYHPCVLCGCTIRPRELESHASGGGFHHFLPHDCATALKRDKNGTTSAIDVPHGSALGWQE